MRGPLVARTGGEPLGEPGPQRGPAAAVALGGQLGPGDAQPLKQRREELRFQCGDGHVFAVAALVGVVEGGGPVEEVRAPLVRPLTHAAQRVRHLAQQGGPVDHGGVHDLPGPGACAFPERGQDTDDQEHGTAPEISHQVERRGRRITGAAHRVEQPGETYVVQVVPGILGERALLTPTGDACVDEPRILPAAVFGADAEALGDAWPEALDQHIGPGGQRPYQRTPLGPLEVGEDRPAAAPHDVGRVVRAEPQRPAGGPLDAHHVGAEIGQHHARVRSRPESASSRTRRPTRGPADPSLDCMASRYQKRYCCIARRINNFQSDRGIPCQLPARFPPRKPST